MKKIFTLFAACAATMSMLAGNFQLYFGDKPVENGATYTTYYKLEAEDEYKGKIYKTWIQDADLFLHGTPGTDVTMEVTSAQEVSVCSLDGNCVMLNTPGTGNSVVKKGKINVDGESAEIHQTTDTVDDEDPAPKMQDIVVKIVAYETANPDSKVSITVNMTNKAASSISSAFAEKNYIKVEAGNVLKYNVDRPATLQIYAITGNLAAKYQIAKAGTVNLNNLGKGIYIYTDGTHKGKFIIR